MISSLALGSEIRYGIYLIQTLLSLYKIMFVAVVIYNSGAWNNITELHITKLRTAQLKFLKRILHASSTTATVTRT